MTTRNRKRVKYWKKYIRGRAYDRLQKYPFQGSGRDVIARMKNHNGENVILQRGEAIRGENGKIVACGGNAFKRLTGTKSNYGLNKAIYKHDMLKEQVTKIPKIIRRNPVEITEFGQDVYLFKTQNGDIRVVTSLKDGKKILSSMYKIDR